MDNRKKGKTMTDQEEHIMLKKQWIEVPCLPGERLYYIIPGNLADELDPPRIFEDTCTDVSTKAIFGIDARYEKDELGKDLFLTREEAQKELEKRYPEINAKENTEVLL